MGTTRAEGNPPSTADSTLTQTETSRTRGERTKAHDHGGVSYTEQPRRPPQRSAPTNDSTSIRGLQLGELPAPEAQNNRSRPKGYTSGPNRETSGQLVHFRRPNPCACRVVGTANRQPTRLSRVFMPSTGDTSGQTSVRLNGTMELA